MHSITKDVRVLRLVGLILILIFTCPGVLLLVQGDGATPLIGLLLLLTGCTWLAVDVLRRCGVIQPAHHRRCR